MKHFNKICKGMKVAIASIMAAAVVAGSTVSSAAEAGEANDKFVKSSFFLGNEDSQEEEIITNIYEKWKSIEIMDSDNRAKVAGHDYSWTMGPQEVCIIGNIYCVKGKKIGISCNVDKGNLGDDVVAGIIYPDDTVRVIDQPAMVYEFEIEKSGNYTIFVRNISSSTVTVNLLYYFT